MNETEVFLKYEKTTAAMDIASKIIAGAMFAVVVICAVIGFVFNEKIDFIICFYIAAAAAVIYAFVAIPMRIISMRRKDTVELCRSYLKVLGRDPRNAVDEIREGTGEADQKIVDNFIRLDSFGFFKSIFIDKENKIVNCGNVDKTTDEFECPVCGGKTDICQGEADKCGFCGAVKEKEATDDGN